MWRSGESFNKTCGTVRGLESQISKTPVQLVINACHVAHQVMYFEGLSVRMEKSSKVWGEHYCILYKIVASTLLLWIKKKLERAQRRAAKMRKGLKNLLCDDRLKEFNVFSSSESKLRGDLISVSKYLQGGDF